MRSWGVLAVLALGCSKPPLASGQEAGPPVSALMTFADSVAPSPAPTRDVTAPAPAPIASASDPCVAIAARFHAVLDAANGRCARDSDCACFSYLGLDTDPSVSDRATAETLQGYSDDYAKRMCPTACVERSWRAPPPKCSARCQDGVCR
jgi:hypothetical protein